MDWFIVIFLSSFAIIMGLTGWLIVSYGELQCIDFSKKLYQHIHIILTVDGKSAPGGIGLAQGCFREIHTHWPDHWVHLESNTPKNFTLGEFFELWGLGQKDRTVMINGSPADFSTVLNDMDKVVVTSVG